MHFKRQPNKKIKTFQQFLLNYQHLKTFKNN